MDVVIWPPKKLTDAEITLPSSKSESNRSVIIRALTPGVDPRSAGLSDCDDTRAILGGVSARPGQRVDVGPAGAAMRFLTAFYAVSPGMDVIIDGNSRMRQRPIGPLVDALRQCGARVEYVGAVGFPPLHIEGRRLAGGEAEIDATVSSQFISALMMAAPVMERGLRLRLRGRPASRPYLDMTARLMRMAGAEVTLTDRRITVAKGGYSPFDYRAEGDWSGASYWCEAAALASGAVTLRPLYADSLQGDSRLVELMKALGVKAKRVGGDALRFSFDGNTQERMEADMGDTPDLAQTMAVTCCLLGTRFRFAGLESLVIKETDRIAALRRELHKLGYVTENPASGVLQWEGSRISHADRPVIESYGDHRMVMAFAPAAMLFPGVRISGAECVSKSYPNFWADMESAGFIIEQS